MIQFANCPILHTHLSDGALQGTCTMVKDNKFYWLEGYQTISTGEQINFKKGWYNDKLEYVGAITQKDHDYIKEYVSTPF